MIKSFVNSLVEDLSVRMIEGFGITMSMFAVLTRPLTVILAEVVGHKALLWLVYDGLD